MRGAVRLEVGEGGGEIVGEGEGLGEAVTHGGADRPALEGVGAAAVEEDKVDGEGAGAADDGAEVGGVGEALGEQDGPARAGEQGGEGAGAEYRSDRTGRKGQVVGEGGGAAGAGDHAAVEVEAEDLPEQGALGDEDGAGGGDGEAGEVGGGAEDGVGVKVRAGEQAGDGDLALGEDVVRVGAAGEEAAEVVQARVVGVAEGERVGGERGRGHGRTVARAGRDVNGPRAGLDLGWRG
jgi:hypothetical protein